MQWFIEAIFTLCKAYTDEQILNGKNMPTNSIVLWFGERVDIPDGWLACDGSHSTPDLRGRFMRGAGGGNAPGGTGGTTSHVHAGESEHQHNLSPGTDLGTGKGIIAQTDPPHGVGDTGSAGTLPPYHNLWYIMKS